MAVTPANKIVRGGDLQTVGTEIKSALAGKQDTISDLATIRSGASAGATAYQKPSTGIPASDLASNVLSGKQDTLVSGTNIKTINGSSILAGGDLSIVGITSISSQQDGSLVISMTNGDTYTIDLNHSHSQYLKYVLLPNESSMPASPDSKTLYLIPETNA